MVSPLGVTEMTEMVDGVRERTSVLVTIVTVIVAGVIVALVVAVVVACQSDFFSVPHRL